MTRQDPVGPGVAEHWTAQYWEERYRGGGPVWSGRPNPWLVEVAGQLAPGRALDVGCGEGADVCWLAEQGWQVTGVDISAGALDRVRSHLGTLDPQVAARVHLEQCDLASQPLPAGEFDLVSAQYVHPPVEARPAVRAMLVGAVAPGGTLLIAGHDAADLTAGIHRPHPEALETPEDLAAAVPANGWEILVAETRRRPAQNHPAQSHHGHAPADDGAPADRTHAPAHDRPADAAGFSYDAVLRARRLR